jgi:hypothetical protein
MKMMAQGGGLAAFSGKLRKRSFNYPFFHEIETKNLDPPRIAIVLALAR